MIELTQRIEGEDMTRGLAPKDLGFRSPFPKELLNLLPEEEGLRGYERLEDPFDGGVSVNWPFPQVFETQEGYLLFQESQVQEITTATSPWGLSSVTTYDPENPSNTKAITDGKSWQIASFGPSWYATNSSALVFRTGLDNLSSGSSPKTFVADSVTFETIAAQKGRVFLGGIEPDLWESTFESFFQDWQDQLNNQNLDPSFAEIGKNWIAYSSIGGGDLPLWLFHPQGYNTDVGPTKDRVLDRFERNELGFLPLPVDGKVLSLKPLGDNLVAYCDEATFLIQLEFPRTEEVPPTVGYRKLIDAGIYSRNAVAGDEFGHLFVDQFGSLWQISSDGQPENLGYRNQFEGLLSGECLAWQSRHNEYTYIGFDSSGFVLTERGLAEISESPTFLVPRGREDKGLALSHNPYSAQYVGTKTDFSERGRKTATSIAAAYSGDANVECGFDYRYTPDGTWQRTDLQLTNKRGISYVRQAGGAFRVVIEADDPSKFDLDYIELRFQLDDARHQRGPRVGQTAS